MKQEEIEKILKMRVAVYQAGVEAEFWKDINANGATAMMDYIFSKSGQMAYYNLLMEQMKVEHKMLTGGVYSLFKLPVQVEKEIVDYLRNHTFDFLNIGQAPNEYLQQMDTIATDHRFDVVCIGSFSANDIDNQLRLCASHYRYAFNNNVKSFPYFE